MSDPQVALRKIDIVNGNTAVARQFNVEFRVADANGNVLNVNFDWSAARGTIDPNGNYIPPATTGPMLLIEPPCAFTEFTVWKSCTVSKSQMILPMPVS